jgi:ribosomal protein S18 acetylase RimI-like enzyme
MAAITIRPAKPSDLPTLSHIDDLANSSHPMRKIRFRSTPPVKRDAILLSAWESHFRNPAFRFFVAVLPAPDSEEKMAGFLTWKKWTSGSEKENEQETEKVRDEDKDEEFEKYTKEIMRRCGEKYRLDEYHTLDTVVIHPELQRMGIGKKLMETFMEDLEKEGDGRGCVIVSSAAGRGLYERFEWELVSFRTGECQDGDLLIWLQIGENVWELGRWGWEEPYISFVMKREGA